VAERTAAACDARVTLPGSGRVESLNVSVAAAVLIHALSVRR
jgi:TrmH RNA methyltransferase